MKRKEKEPRAKLLFTPVIGWLIEASMHIIFQNQSICFNP
jgi:hypothetical protein